VTSPPTCSACSPSELHSRDAEKAGKFIDFSIFTRNFHLQLAQIGESVEEPLDERSQEYVESVEDIPEEEHCDEFNIGSWNCQTWNLCLRCHGEIFDEFLLSGYCHLIYDHKKLS
jgi:hypothetical protein